jgi:hypothetical protein
MDLPNPSELSLYISGLSLLFNVYQSTKPGVAAKLDELIKELRGFRPAQAQSQTRAELDRKLEDKLLPEVGSIETEAVKRDLDLVAVLSEPIDVEDFDYLNTLSAYGSKYAALADKASLFDLRGAVDKGESLLYLPTAGPCLVAAEEAATLLCSSTWPSYRIPVGVTSSDAVLTKREAEFGLKFVVFANFKCQDRMTRSSQDVEIGCGYVLGTEGRKNWIKLEPQAPVEGFQWMKKRLDAEDVLRFMKAVRYDVMKYVSELKKETALIKGDISSLLQEVTHFFQNAKTQS